MIEIFRRKTQLEKLRTQYATLMKRSYEKALEDTEESKRLQDQAMKIHHEIQLLSSSYSEN